MPRLTLQSIGPAPLKAHRQGIRVGMLGPTNTGKTFFAIERMLAHRSGMIGLPLRLLAREVYDKVVARVGAPSVALVTGEEKIVPATARYWIATVEAMPLERDVEFLAIDEIQLAGDLERGRVFTSRLLSARGVCQTMYLGSDTMRPILRRLFPDIELQARERFSALTYAGSKKVSRLPRRAAVVAFSSDTVYALAELVRRQRGGAAVVLGALSPRTRNAQAALYQQGDVDYLIATDAIGMGLNMDIDHVAFAARRKFDGRTVRDLRPDELAQIAGRAGRHIKDGRFGITADCPTLDEDIVSAIEEHRFDPLSALQWRSERLEFSSLHNLRLSLEQAPPSDLFRRAPPGEDEQALARLATVDDIRQRTQGVAAVGLLWEVCQIPDFRKASIDQHVRLLGEIYEQLIDVGSVKEAWLAPRVERLDRTDGDIDSISTRIAYIRTWTYLSNRSGWLENAGYWQQRTRSIEDALSDALHEKLTQRFVDRRTSVLMKRLRDDSPLLAGVSDEGDVIVEGQFVGRLMGFEFLIDPRAKGPEAKKVRRAAERALTPVLAVRAAALANADPRELELRNDGVITWRNAEAATLTKGPTPWRPNVLVRGLDAVSPTLRGRVLDRLRDFLAARVEVLLGELLKVKRAVDDIENGGLTGQARGIAYRLVENFGAMSRAPVAEELRQLGQDERAKLRGLGVRFGEYTLYMPTLLKPAPSRLLTLLWALWTERDASKVEPPKPGLVSLVMSEDLPHAYYYAAGYRPSGNRAVRIDMLERLAGQVRSDRTNANTREGFTATAQMMSLVGCSGEEFESILRSLGYRKHTVKRPRVNTPDASAMDPAVSAGDAPAEPQESAEPSDLALTETEPALANDPVSTVVSPDPLDATAVDGASVAAPQGPAPVELIDVEVWRLAPRRPPRKPPQAQQSNAPKRLSDANAVAPSGEKRRDESRTPPRRDKAATHRSDRHGRPGGERRNDNSRGNTARSFSAGGRSSGPDPNSPFAVLASLKAGLLRGPEDTDGN